MNDALLQSASRLNEAGNLLEAARLYANIIRADPRHFEALHRLAFDTKRFAGNLETAFRLMWECYQAGEPPARFSITDAA